MEVERCSYELRGLIADQELLRAIDTIGLCTALRSGGPLPASSIESRMHGLKDIHPSHPTLTQEELDREFKAALHRAEQTWNEIYDDGAWDSEDERSNHLADHLHEARQEAVSARADRAGRSLIKLCDHLAETVWPEVTAAARAADLERAARGLKEAFLAAETAPALYKLYEVNLSIKYESAPYSLGGVGEQLMAFESWLGLQNEE